MKQCPECELNCCDCNEPFAKRIEDLETENQLAWNTCEKAETECNHLRAQVAMLREAIKCVRYSEGTVRNAELGRTSPDANSLRRNGAQVMNLYTISIAQEDWEAKAERLAELEAQLFNEKERVEEYKREVERRDELLAGADYRNAELQAEAAAMRNTLEVLDRLGGLGYQKHDWIKAALAPDAGKALLERLEKVRRDRDKALIERWRLPQQDLENARARALEEAATLIEGVDLWSRYDQAAAIRALASKQPVPREQHHQNNQDNYPDDSAGPISVTGTGSPRGNGQSAQGENNQDNEQDGHAGHTKHSGKETP